MLRRLSRLDPLGESSRKERRPMRAVNSWVTKKAFIRRPGPDDIEQLLSIERQSFRAHRFTKEDFEYHLRNPSSIFAVSESSGKIVGYIAGIVYHGARHRVGKLYSMAVVSKFRKQGIGSLLLKYFEHEALKRKCVSVTLEVRSTNRSAQALYRRFGYEVEQVLPDYYGPGSVGLRMRKTFKHSGPRVR